MEGIWLLVRINLPLPGTLLLLAHTYQVDVELGLQPVNSTPTSLETPEYEDVVDRSALPAEHAGAVAVPEHMLGPTQNTELQNTLPTTVDAETSPNPSSAQGAQIGDNDIPNVDNENAQPTISDMEHGELRVGTNDDQDPARVH